MSLSKSTVEQLFFEIMKTCNQKELYNESQRWALSNGFLRRCWDEEGANGELVKPYPFTLFPSPFPCYEYERARQIQSTINILVRNLASNIDLMNLVLEPISECDEFIKRLWEILMEIENLPFHSVAEACIIRTDFMLQDEADKQQRTNLRLIELNTIAVGLGAAAKLMHSWHKRFLRLNLPELLSSLPENESYDLIIETLFQSWKIYDNPQAWIVFVVPEKEFNMCDQCLIEDGLLSRGKPHLVVKYLTFNAMIRNCSIDRNGNLFYLKNEIGLVYYRYGYDPKHFSNEKIWKTYQMIESSRAVKCPSLRYHLAGMKCFQLALGDSMFLEKLFPNQHDLIEDIQQISEEMFTLDQIKEDSTLQTRIDKYPDSLYLKQSREGGGNVYCGPDLRNRIDRIIKEGESKRYFLMSRIYGKKNQSCIQSQDKNQSLLFEEINSELGFFSGLISKNGELVFERVGGSLLRSKPAINIEGGIASGQGCIDSVVLI